MQQRMRNQLFALVLIPAEVKGRDLGYLDRLVLAVFWNREKREEVLLKRKLWGKTVKPIRKCSSSSGL